MTVSTKDRFSKRNPCPICGGYKEMPRSKGVRCWGFLSPDGKWANCVRDEYAGTLPKNTGSEAYGHRLDGSCKCGNPHSPVQFQPQVLYPPDVHPMAPHSHRDLPARGRIVKTYDYQNANGDLVHQTVRYDPKAFSQRRPDGAGGWIWNLQGVTTVLYRIHGLLFAAPGSLVFVVEGEKDVDNLVGLGLIATTNPMGAGKWRSYYAPFLKDFHVVVIQDADDAGRKHGKQVAASVLPVAASVKVLEMPDGKDVSEWLALGHSTQEFEALVRSTPLWSPPLPTTPIAPTPPVPKTPYMVYGVLGTGAEAPPEMPPPGAYTDDDAPEPEPEPSEATLESRFARVLKSWVNAAISHKAASDTKRKGAPEDKDQLDDLLQKAKRVLEAVARNLASVYLVLVKRHEEEVDALMPRPRDDKGNLIRPHVIPMFFANKANPTKIRSFGRPVEDWENIASLHHQRRELMLWSWAWFDVEVNVLGGSIYYASNSVQAEDAGNESGLWEAQSKAISRQQDLSQDKVASFLYVHTPHPLGNMMTRHVFSNMPFKAEDGLEAQVLEQPISMLQEVVPYMVKPPPIWSKGPSEQARKAAAKKGKVAKATGRHAWGSSENWRMLKKEPDQENILLGPQGVMQPTPAELEMACISWGVRTWRGTEEERQHIDAENITEIRHFQFPKDMGPMEILMFLWKELDVFVYPKQRDKFIALFQEKPKPEEEEVQPTS